MSELSETRREIKRLYAERDRIDFKISQSLSWGALLTALSERRRGVENAIRALEANVRRKTMFPERDV